MKTWFQFREDAKSFAKDKEAYEKSIQSQEKLAARRRSAKRSSLNSKTFTKQMQSKISQIKKDLDSQELDYQQKSDYINAVKEKERQIRNKTVRKGSSTLNKTLRGAKNITKKVIDKIKSRQQAQSNQTP